MKLLATARCRHLLVHLEAGESLPAALAQALERQSVEAGWLRATGVLRDVDVRMLGAPEGSTRHLEGPLEVVVLEGLASTTPAGRATTLRAILAHATAQGAETIAGEILSARVVMLDVVVATLDGLAPVAAPGPVSTWSDAVAASAVAEDDKARPGAFEPGALRRARAASTDEETAVPEPGDIVEHFAFGRCEVLLGEGERLKIRVAKDARVREIALEVLRVSLLSTDGDRRIFRLDRKA